MRQRTVAQSTKCGSTSFFVKKFCFTTVCLSCADFSSSSTVVVGFGAAVSCVWVVVSDSVDDGCQDTRWAGRHIGTDLILCAGEFGVDVVEVLIERPRSLAAHRYVADPAKHNKSVNCSITASNSGADCFIPYMDPNAPNASFFDTIPRRRRSHNLVISLVYHVVLLLLIITILLALFGSWATTL